MIFTLLPVFHSFECSEDFSHPKYKRRGKRDPDPFGPRQRDGSENGTTEVDHEYLSHDNGHSHGKETFRFWIVLNLEALILSTLFIYTDSYITVISYHLNIKWITKDTSEIEMKGWD